MKRTATALVPAALNLSAPHGYRSTAEGARWVEARFQGAIVRDHMLVERVCQSATDEQLASFLTSQNRRNVTTRQGLVASAFTCIMGAWWPVLEMPAETAGAEPVAA